MAVNLSARQLGNPELIPHIEGSITANGIEPSTLWLELTESTVLDDTVYVERTLGALERLGVRLVLDDFGVGFSSLGYLKRLPLSMVKLDRTFVENVTESAFDAAIVRAVSDMAETIGIGVVAEGVRDRGAGPRRRGSGLRVRPGLPLSRSRFRPPPSSAYSLVRSRSPG